MQWLVDQATAHVRQEEGVMMAQMRGGDDHDKTRRDGTKQDTTLVEMEEKRMGGESDCGDNAGRKVGKEKMSGKTRRDYEAQ